jgi:hypothetical protein
MQGSSHTLILLVVHGTWTPCPYVLMRFGKHVAFLSGLLMHVCVL